MCRIFSRSPVLPQTVSHRGIEGSLRRGFLVVKRRHCIEVFRLEDLPAIQAPEVIHAVAPGDHFRPGMVANRFHNA